MLTPASSTIHEKTINSDLEYKQRDFKLLVIHLQYISRDLQEAATQYSTIKYRFALSQCSTIGSFFRRHNSFTSCYSYIIHILGNF